jgi:hypothetical protein
MIVSIDQPPGIFFDFRIFRMALDREWAFRVALGQRRKGRT